jgi:hypothetical protein
VAVVAAVLPALGGGSSVAHADTAGGPGVSKPKSAEQAAAVQAAASGDPVEVVGDRTEYSTTYAEPDGMSFRLDQSVVPVRVHRADGSWVAPDPTLEVRPDGSVGPRAAVVDLAFSGGGEGAGLVKVTRNGKWLSLGWPGSLPKPVLDGATASYPDVLDGVDLRMTASAAGFSELLVVKTPQAAANPQLQRIEFALQSEGVTVGPSGGGGMTAVDTEGRPVFSAPAALMWDSRGDDVAGDPVGASGDASAATGSSSAPRSDAARGASSAADDPSSGPGDGDASAVLPVEVTAASLAVTPDPELLANPDSGAYPLYIDPSVGLAQSARTQLRSDGYTNYNWGNGSNNEGEGMGHCSSYAGYYCGPGYTERLYYQFSPSQLTGKKVLDATFRDTESWSFTCDAKQVDLERTGNITSATSWSTRPNNLGVVATRTVAAGRGSECSPSQPAAPIEFHDARLTTQVADLAAGKFSQLTLLLLAHDESDTSAWKRFRNDAVLSVTYVGLPAVPTNYGLVAGTGVGCESDWTDPQIVGDTTPSMTAKTATQSGGASGASLRIYFYVEHQAVDKSWAMVTEPVRPSSGYIGSGVTETDPTPVTLKDGDLYRLAVYTRSYYNNGANYIQSNSNLSTTGWCYFRVDTTAPKPPVITGGGPYSECLPDVCAAAGGPGIPGQFTFGPASGDVNISYQYKLASDKQWSAEIAGATVQKTITPQLAGTQQLLVRAKDGAGWGQSAPFLFNVKEGQGPVGQWHFDDGVTDPTVTTVADTATEGIRHNATRYTAGSGWSTFGRRGNPDQSLWLNDTSVTANQTGYAATDTPVVNTQASFTISAWVWLSDDTQFRAVLAQPSNDTSGFSLYYSPGLHRWVFSWSWNEGTTHQAMGAGTNVGLVAPLKVWTHLTGVYDRTNQTLLLYVNGRPQGAPVQLPDTAVAGAANGALQFGRSGGATTGTFTDYWRGRLDEVSVWQRALTSDEIALDDAMQGTDGTPAVEMVADWNPDGATGTTLADTVSGYGRNLALTGGASLDGQALVLDGTSGAAKATPDGPLVDGTGSFTATTLADLDSAALANKPIGYTAQLIGQRSTTGSSWGIWYQLTSELLQRCRSRVRTALAIDVMRLGLHRDRRKIRQDFSRAMPRSTGARAAARARLRVFSVGVSSCRGLRLMPVVSQGPAPW